MKTSVFRYQKIKNAARKLMLAGNVERYLHALRLMSGLRPEGTGTLA